MNLATGIVLAAVLAVAGLALRSVIKRVKRGDLCGTCGQSCGGSCGHCSAQNCAGKQDVEALIEAIKQN